jgi:hypothetical protein
MLRRAGRGRSRHGIGAVFRRAFHAIFKQACVGFDPMSVHTFMDEVK